MFFRDGQEMSRNDHEWSGNGLEMMFCLHTWFLKIVPAFRAYGVVVSMFDFHLSDRGSNPGCGGKIS